jgi:anti-sigma B factor antagonist
VPSSPFSCHLHIADGVGRLRLAGELDMATAPKLERTLADALDAGCKRILVDLRELAFMDSTGLVVLARWDLGARLDGYDLALIPGPAQIQRLFTISGLDRQFTFEEPG